MPAPHPVPRPEDVKHTVLDDAQGLSTGILMCSFGVVLLTHLGLLTGQTAGVAVLLSYVTGGSFGLWFFLVNLPFYWLAWTKMGRVFTLKSLGCVAALSLVTDLLPLGLTLGPINPALGAVLFGVIVGFGLLAVIRHGGSLGGMTVLALWIQERTGFRAGYVQLIFDGGLFLLAAFLFPLSMVVWSLLGAVILNGIIAFNHRRDRYIA